MGGGGAGGKFSPLIRGNESSASACRGNGEGLTFFGEFTSFSAFSDTIEDVSTLEVVTVDGGAGGTGLDMVIELFRGELMEGRGMLGKLMLLVDSFLAIM